jgi:hypothetical protein
MEGDSHNDISIFHTLIKGKGADIIVLDLRPQEIFLFVG